MSKLQKHICYVIALLLSLSGCSVNDKNDLALDSSTNAMASVKVFNAIPNSSNLDIAIGSIHLNTGVKLAYANALAYKTILPGNQTVKIIYSIDGQTYSYQEQIEFARGKFYSLFICVEDDAVFIKTEDDVLLPSIGHAKIRLANLSNSTRSFRVASGTNELFGALRFKEITAFKEIKSNEEQSLTLKSTLSTGNEDIALDFTPKEGGIYTLMITGNTTAEKKENMLQFHLIQH